MYCWRAGIILLSFWPTISWSGLRKLVQPFQGLQNKNHWALRWLRWPLSHAFLQKAFEDVYIFFDTSTFVQTKAVYQFKGPIQSLRKHHDIEKSQTSNYFKGTRTSFQFLLFYFRALRFFASMKEISCIIRKLLAFYKPRKAKNDYFIA